MRSGEADRVREPTQSSLLEQLEGPPDYSRTPLELLAQRLGGEVEGVRVLAPGPGKPPSDRSLAITRGRGLPAGLLIFDTSNLHADTRANRAYVLARLGSGR